MTAHCVTVHLDQTLLTAYHCVLPANCCALCAENSIEAVSAHDGVIELVIDPNHRRVIVKDNGKGMREETLKRAVHVGAPKKRELTVKPEVNKAADRKWQSADFGRSVVGVHN